MVTSEDVVDLDCHAAAGATEGGAGVEPPPADLRLPAVECIAKDIHKPLVPQQQEITAFVMSRWSKHTRAMAGASQQQMDTLRDCGNHNVLPLLQSSLEGVPGGKISFTPTSHLLEFDCGRGQRIGLREWQVWACMSWGLANPQALAATMLREKCKCTAAYDLAGHHRAP